MGLQRCPPVTFTVPQVRVFTFFQRESHAGCSRTPRVFSNHQTPLMQGLEAGKRVVRGETEAVVAGRTSSQPRAWEQRTSETQPFLGSAATGPPQPRASPPRARHCCARSCEGPTLRLRGRNGGVPGPAPPRGARPYLGKLCPADWGSRSCFRPRSRTFLRTGWWAARDRGTQGQARCECPLPRVCTSATSRPDGLGKQLRCCEPPFLC